MFEKIQVVSPFEIGSHSYLNSHSSLVLYSLSVRAHVLITCLYIIYLYHCFGADIDVGQADCFEDCPMSNWTTHMVRGTWLSKNHNIFYYGLPSPLLDYLRRVRNPMQYEKTLVIFLSLLHM